LIFITILSYTQKARFNGLFCYPGLKPGVDWMVLLFPGLKPGVDWMVLFFPGLKPGVDWMVLFFPD
jgi:hypothetical protein